nr:hypothetical protein GCM10025699_08620 [Microbacterium flavescens]
MNSAFAKTFRSGIQPVEIASALRSELDKKVAVVSRDRILAPNTFTVHLSPTDDEKMGALGTALGHELDTLVHKHAKSQGYSFAGPVSISLLRDDQISTGTLRVESSTAQGGRVSWRGVVDIAGKRHPLVKGRTVIGRGSDADITVADAGTSRKHVEILWDGERAMVRDLKSTNGTLLDGRKVAEAALPPDSTVTIGRTDIVFHVVAQAAPPPKPTMTAEDATRAYDLRDGGPCRERTHPPAPADRLPRPAVGLRVRGDLLAARRPLRGQGPQDARGRSRRSAGPAAAARTGGATAAVAPHPQPCPPAPRAGRPRPPPCRAS